MVRLPNGTAHALNARAFPIAVMGKTGTTNAYRDAIFVGSTYGAEGVTVAVRIGSIPRIVVPSLFSQPAGRPAVTRSLRQQASRRTLLGVILASLWAFRRTQRTNMEATVRLKSLLLVTLVLGLGHTASAATISIFDRAAFQAAVSGGGVTQQDFDGFLDGTLLVTDGAVNYSASMGTPVVTDTFLTTTVPNGLGSTSIGFFLPAETATFSFLAPITAFGIDINTFAPTEGAYQATLNIGDLVLSKFDVFPGAATGQFVGFTSDTPFSSVTIAALTGFSYTLDTLVYGDARALVPEPASIGLLGLGLMAWAVKRRRGRNTQ